MNDYDKVNRLMKQTATVTDVRTGEVCNTNYVLTEDEAWDIVHYGEMSFKYEMRDCIPHGILTIKIADVILTMENSNLRHLVA